MAFSTGVQAAHHSHGRISWCVSSPVRTAHFCSYFPTHSVKHVRTIYLSRTTKRIFGTNSHCRSFAHLHYHKLAYLLCAFPYNCQRGHIG